MRLAVRIEQRVRLSAGSPLSLVTVLVLGGPDTLDKLAGHARRPPAPGRLMASRFPGGLAAVHIDREQDRGSYWEPNVWMRHTL